MAFFSEVPTSPPCMRRRLVCSPLPLSGCAFFGLFRRVSVGVAGHRGRVGAVRERRRAISACPSKMLAIRIWAFSNSWSGGGGGACGPSSAGPRRRTDLGVGTIWGPRRRWRT